MTTSRRLYVAVAAVINDTANSYGSRTTSKSEGVYAVERVAGELADIFAEDNPRFDRARFLRACGVLP